MNSGPIRLESTVFLELTKRFYLLGRETAKLVR